MSSRRDSQRTWNLLPWSMASQYSTPNRPLRRPAETVPRRAGQQDRETLVANGLHAGEHDVKPHGIRRNRTSSAANGAPAGRVRSSRDGNREFFQNRPPPDGPRPQVARLLPAACALVPGSGTLAGGDVPCPSRWPDTAGPPAAATIALPPRYRPCYSTGKGMRRRKPSLAPLQETNPRTATGRGLRCVSKSNHAEYGPRERQLPKAKSRQRSTYSTPGRFGPLTSCMSNISPA